MHEHSNNFIICANGVPGNDLRVPASFAAATVIAADGGARLANALDLHVSHLVGDLDSLDANEVADLARTGTNVTRYPAEKDETDLELAVQLVVELAAKAHAPDFPEAPELLVLGVGGGRPDHAVANLHVLTGSMTRPCHVHLEYFGTAMQVVRPNQRVEFTTPVGAIVSLIPMHGDAHGVTTSGLAYALHDETLASGHARGVANVIASTPASVSIRSGVLLAVEPDSRLFTTNGQSPSPETKESP